VRQPWFTPKNLIENDNQNDIEYKTDLKHVRKYHFNLKSWLSNVGAFCSHNFHTPTNLILHRTLTSTMMAMEDEIMFEAMEGVNLCYENDTTTNTDYYTIQGVAYSCSYDAMDGIEYEGNNDSAPDEEELKMENENDLKREDDEVMLDAMLYEYCDDSPDDNLEDEMMALEVQLWY
jgi:hypothetical protein